MTAEFEQSDKTKDKYARVLLLHSNRFAYVPIDFITNLNTKNKSFDPFKSYLCYYSKYYSIRPDHRLSLPKPTFLYKVKVLNYFGKHLICSKQHEKIFVLVFYAC